jgi:hypothetical protein
MVNFRQNGAGRDPLAPSESAKIQTQRMDIRSYTCISAKKGTTPVTYETYSNIFREVEKLFDMHLN